jgi:hypothetical protein
MNFADLFSYLVQLNEDKSPFQRIFVNQVFHFPYSSIHFCADHLSLHAPFFITQMPYLRHGFGNHVLFGFIHYLFILFVKQDLYLGVTVTVM